MLPIKEVREITMYSPMEQKNVKRARNICIGNDGREIVQHWDGYYYLSNDGSRVTKRRYKL
jgi:hypothetical protein